MVNPLQRLYLPSRNCWLQTPISLEVFIRLFRVDESVSEEKFLWLKILIFLLNFCPLFGRNNTFLKKSRIEVRQLLNEGDPDLEVWPPAVKELQCFQKRPFVLSHQVRREHRRRSRLTSHRVDKHRLSTLICLFYEIVNLRCDFVLFVKQDLVLAIMPIKR